MEGFLYIDKPAGMTSHDVIDRVRRITGVKRVGHAGTLDPFATGLLLVGVGRGATRHMQELVGLDKTYVATFVLGATSDTDDIEGTITSTETKPVDEQAVKNALRTFIGTIKQVPPVYSAVKVKGKKLYEEARKGRPIKAEPREVHINEFRLDTFNWPELETTICCGSGTYIRALARDLGEALGVGGYVTSLRRTHVGPISIDDATDLPTLEQEDWSNYLQPVQNTLTLVKTYRSAR